MANEILKPVPGMVIIRNTYYRPENLRATVEWAHNKLASAVSGWERRYLQDEIACIERALA